MRWRWFLDYLAAWQTLLMKGNWGDFRAIYRARKAFAKWKHDFDTDRQVIQQSRVVARVPERRPYSILWQYYVKGRKHYSDL